MTNTAIFPPATRSQKYPHSTYKNTKPSKQSQTQNITQFNDTTKPGRTPINYWMMGSMGLRLGSMTVQDRA